MEVFEAIEKRKSIRRYQQDKPIPEAKLQKVLKAGAWRLREPTVSCGNSCRSERRGKTKTTF